MEKTTMHYLMKELNKEFWKKVQHLAIDRNMNVKELILDLLSIEINKGTKIASKYVHKKGP